MRTVRSRWTNESFAGGAARRGNRVIPADLARGIARAWLAVMRLASALVYLLFSWATAHMVTTLLIDRSERQSADAAATSDTSR